VGGEEGGECCFEAGRIGRGEAGVDVCVEGGVGMGLEVEGSISLDVDV